MFLFLLLNSALLPNVEVADLALDYVKAHAEIPVVLDPVLVCKESHDVEVSALRDELIKFFPYVTIITPNLPEAEILTQSKIQSLDDMKAVARKLQRIRSSECRGQGGNRLNKEKAIDVFYDGTDFTVIEEPVLEKNNTGAGCTFASSISSQLVQGKSPLEAVKASKDFVFQAIQHSDQYGVVQYDI